MGSSANRLWRQTLAAAVVVAVASQPVSAAGWPTPAAGRSASKGPELVLTFDDGPNPTYTPKVLDILKERGIKAIFFIVGEMVAKNKKGQALLARIAAEGHIIANHTMTHQDLCRVKEDRAQRDLDEGQDVAQKWSPIPVAWFRAPYGAKCKRLEDMLAERKKSHFHWDLDPQEWKNKEASKVFDYVTGSVARSADRNVLLLHDIHQVTVDVLPQILDWIDKENESRAAIGKKPILLVPGWQIARERLAKGLWPWLEQTGKATDVRSWVASVIP